MKFFTTLFVSHLQPEFIHRMSPTSRSYLFLWLSKFLRFIYLRFKSSDKELCKFFPFLVSIFIFKFFIFNKKSNKIIPAIIPVKPSINNNFPKDFGKGVSL